MSRTLLISDLALGCEKTAAQRYFANARQMDKLLIERWEQTVEKNDLVYLLGDTCITARSRKALMLKLSHLPGYKFILQGDRDPVGTGPDVFEFTYPTIYGEKRVILCHYPFERWKGDAGNSIHIHGHIASATTTSRNKRNRFNVCAEAVGYAPIELGSLLGGHME